MRFSTGIVLFFGLLMIASSVARASDSGIATTIPVSGNVRGGSVVVNTDHGLRVSTTPYESSIFGVAVQKPAVFITTGSGYPIISSGTAKVLVSTINGSIQKGDFLVTSAIEGTAMKATRSGYSLGVALEAYAAADKQAIGLIDVAVNPRYIAQKPTIESNLFNVLQLSTLASYEDPLTVFKYFVAAAVLLVSIAAGFFSFGRVAARGVEALGRNPLAGRAIQFGIILNVMITIGIVGAGFCLALFILRM